MAESNRNELAADCVNGVYVCENAAVDSGEILQDMEFYHALKESFEGTIYGNVSDEIAQKIQDEYGVH